MHDARRPKGQGNLPPDAVPEDLEVLFNSTHDAVSLVEHREGAFRFLRNNALHKKLTGFADIRNKTPVDLLGPEVGERLVNYYEQCMRTGRPVTYEQDFTFAPGYRIWQTEVTPVFGEGRIRYLWCASKDVSELKRAQGENEVLLQRLESMFYRHSAIMLIIEPVTGKILDVNPAACAFYGYTKEEFASITMMDLNMLPPEEVDRRLTLITRAKQRYFVFPHRLKNGEIRLVDMYSCPIGDEGSTLLYSIIFDVTDREVYRDELVREKELLQTTLRSIGDGVVTTDNQGRITSLNSVAQELTGWDGEDAVGRPFTEVFRLQNEETGEAVENPVEKVLATGRIVGLANHTELVNQQGKRIPIADSAAPIKKDDDEVYGVVMVFRDVTHEKQQSQQIRFLSYHDPLTGLYNRRFIEEALPGLDAPENLPISIIMGDVNGLKITNDVFGHAAGDSLLRRVAGLLEKNCGKHDLIARWGGDEFMVFLPRTDLARAEAIIQNVKSDYIALDKRGLYLSLSLGCAAKGEEKDNIQTVMRQAEEYMYHQKLLDGKSYRNTIINTLLATLYEKSMETEEHSKRIEAYCHSIGHKLRLSSREMDELSLLAILHDIGKVGITADILKKPEQLTPAEWEEMKRHPEIGYRIVQATPELANVADYILSHHERWDGQGYPRGLKGEEIPLVCRILAVTDAFDAMTNDRIYHKAVNAEKAVAELKKNAGTQFDPNVVKLFVDILRAEGRQQRRRAARR